MEQHVADLLEEVANEYRVRHESISGIERGASQRRRRLAMTLAVVGSVAAATTVGVISSQLGSRGSDATADQPAAASSTPSTTPSENGSVATPAPASVRLAIGETAPLRLFMHCGLRYATIDGRVWETKPQSHNGGAPEGLPDVLVGNATRNSDDMVLFTRSDLGLELTFTPTTLDPETSNRCA
jgi:hypothetical protein